MNRRTHCKYGHELTPENTYQVYKPNGAKDGRRCRECTKTEKAKEYKATKAREYYAADPEKFAEFQRKYRRKTYVPAAKRTQCNRGHNWVDENIYSYISKDGRTIKTCKLCSAEKYKRKALQSRENHLKRKYGLDQETYDKMLIEQDNCCYICKTDVPGGMGPFAVDHCHKTGKVRKLLCYGCNTALGHMNDDPTLLERMAAYIRSYQ